MYRSIARLAVALVATIAFSAIAQDPAAPAAVPAATPAATPPALPGAPAGAPRPFKDVAKDAKETPGFFTLWQKDEKVWIALQPEQLDVPFFFTWNIASSVGERGLYGSQMGGAEVAIWHRIGNHMQLIAKNHEFFAAAGTPQAQFVAESFSDSLLASAPVASLAHPETKAILVEANALLFADIPGYLTRLEAAYRMPFALDTRNTSFSRVNVTEALTGLQVKAHFAVPRIAAPPLVPTPVPLPPPPATLPDPRSLFVGFYYSFAKLPGEPMRARLADDRIGHFVTARTDYSDDIAPKLRTYYVNRWRLEKKDAGAALSPPREPIVYWIDKNVPGKYRESVAGGILEWNKAFERIGIKDAIVVKQQTDKDDFDTMDARHASVRWFTGADVGFAIGPSHKDPRSGEILDADIATGYGFPRAGRRLMEDLGKAHVHDPAAAWIADPLKAHKAGAAAEFLTCAHTWEMAQEYEFAMDLLEVRGMEWDSPEADEIAKAHLRRNVMHEVGHTLGLRHNFRASSVYDLKQVQDPEFTKKNGVVASIMEYMPFNIALTGEKQGEFVNSTIGPYDYWAIEYAYREFDPADEREGLAKIAALSTEPWLAYGTDDDAGGGPVVGMDPEVNRFDLGSDPLEYYKKRMKLTRELWDRLQAMQLKPGESYERLTRGFASGLNQIGLVAPLAAKYVGGVRHLRDHAGTGRPLYEPTPVAKQREALALITADFLQVESFRFKPEFVSRLAIDQFDRPRNPDVSIATTVLNVQKGVLDVLLADGVAARLLDSREKVAERSRVLALSELYDTLQGAIWSEVRSAQDISPMRRNLQREHLRRLVATLVRPSSTTPADARALQRENAIALQRDLRAALSRGGLSKEVRAHLSESVDTLGEALKAGMLRAGA